MATVPLFVADLATLYAKLRLTSITAGSDTEEIVGEALLQTRISIYRRLGDAAVTSLLGETFIENPQTVDKILRASANVLEVKMVRLRLLDVLPVLFMDNSGIEQELINEEATFRSLQPGQLADMRETCRLEIEELFSLLSGETEIGNAPKSRIFTTETQEPGIFPSGTLIGDNRRMWGDPNRRIEGEDGG